MTQRPETKSKWLFVLHARDLSGRYTEKGEVLENSEHFIVRATMDEAIAFKDKVQKMLNSKDEEDADVTFDIEFYEIAKAQSLKSANRWLAEKLKSYDLFVPDDNHE